MTRLLAAAVFAPESYGACMRAFRVFDSAQREVSVELAGARSTARRFRRGHIGSSAITTSSNRWF